MSDEEYTERLINCMIDGGYLIPSGITPDGEQTYLLSPRQPSRRHQSILRSVWHALHRAGLSIEGEE
jgi:hypothetical protein